MQYILLPDFYGHVFLEVWHGTFPLKTWLIYLFKCLAGSESLVALSCSDQV